MDYYMIEFAAAQLLYRNDCDIFITTATTIRLVLLVILDYVFYRVIIVNVNRCQMILINALSE